MRRSPPDEQIRCSGKSGLRPMNIRQLAVVILLGCLSAPIANAEVSVVEIDIGLPHTAVFMVRGGFDGKEILKFKAAISAVPPQKRIVVLLDSPGGLVQQGLQLGEYFYQARIPTMILKNDSCASACTFAFLGGHDPISGRPMRVLADGGRLGFHNTSIVNFKKNKFTAAELQDLSIEIQQGIFTEIQFYKLVEVHLSVIFPMLATKAESIHWLDEADALQLGISILGVDGKLISPDNLRARIDR